MRNPPSKRAGKRESARLFQYGDQWIGTDTGSPNYYRCWYGSNGRVNRKSLGTADFEEAKTRLIAAVLGDAPEDPVSPDNVHFAVVRNFYMDAHGSKIRSSAAAKRAFDLVLTYLKTATDKSAPMVSDFGLARQQAFMRWCRDEHALSSKSIYTYLSTIRAAMNFCAQPRIVIDSKGVERESVVLAAPFFIQTSQAKICQVTGLQTPQPRKFIPSDVQVAALLDATFDEASEKEIRERESLFRYCIIALNTWARPEAITDLDVSRQVDFENGLVDLNPPGRVQTKKYRPTIRLTDNLRGWLLHWNLSRPIAYCGNPIRKLSNKTFDKAAERAGVPEMIPYSLRHYVNTRAMRVSRDVRPDREERATQMGHFDPRHKTTTIYEHMDPDYLARAAAATDAIMATLDKLTRKSLFAPGTAAPGLYVVENRALPLGNAGKAGIAK